MDLEPTVYLSSAAAQLAMVLKMTQTMSSRSTHLPMDLEPTVYLHSAAPQLVMVSEAMQPSAHYLRATTERPHLAHAFCVLCEGGWLACAWRVGGCQPAAEREGRHALAFPHMHTPLTP
jgi:hypothetical protein